MTLDFTKNTAFQGALALAILLGFGCGGTMDLSNLNDSGGSNSTAGARAVGGFAGQLAGGNGGAPDVICGGAGYYGIAGARPASGGHDGVNGGSPAVGGYTGIAGARPASGGYDGVNGGSPAVGGYDSVGGSPAVGGYTGIAGARPAIGGYDGVGGSRAIGGYTGIAGGGSQTATSCVVDTDCVECAAQMNPAISGCYVPCCASTAMNATTCSQHWQIFLASCPNIACTAECQAQPQPQCVSGQCVHGQ